jgi:cell division septation protein DedD
MADEGLHEIQLNGKQLVFLFMASTVVAVVIFLCGVMVGRGVRALQPADGTEASVDAVVDPTASITQRTEPPAATTSIPSNEPVASQETLTYPNRLEGQEPPEERLRRPAAPSAQVATTAKPSSIQRRGGPSGPPDGTTAATSGKALTEPAPREPAGNGFVVQVAAVNDRREADTIAKRLAAKGYPTFVTMPPNGIPKMFRVRIGKYPTRGEAETIAARLEKEDQFKPWITR